MSEHPINSLMDTSMRKIKELIDVNTIIGDPITTPDGTTIIPVSKVTYGFASGGSDLPTKNEKKDLFGGGSGAGVTIQPIAFLTVYQGNVRLISVGNGDGLDKFIGMMPDVVDKVKGFFKKDKKEDMIFDRLDRWIWSLENDKPPTMAGISARSAGTVQSRVMLVKGACVPQRDGVFTP